MKLFSIFLISLLITIQLNSQIITGKVIDTSNGEPLVYASIGVINTTIGTITDEQGNFKLKVDGQMPEAKVRISIISYTPQTFTIGELSGKENTINLIAAPVQLSEVVISPSGKLRKVGNDNYNRKGSSCGWGGSHQGKGVEIGLKLELGEVPVQLNSLHVCIHRQAFDSSLYRLHIRNIENNEPFNELLTENIIITISKETGWVDIDLRKYSIVLKGDVALTFEWLKVFGVNKDRAMKINNDIWTQYVLINNSKKQGHSYTRWGTEAKWTVFDNESPSIYLTVRE